MGLNAYANSQGVMVMYGGLAQMKKTRVSPGSFSYPQGVALRDTLTLRLPIAAFSIARLYAISSFDLIAGAGQAPPLFPKMRF